MPIIASSPRCRWFRWWTCPDFPEIAGGGQGWVRNNRTTDKAPVSIRLCCWEALWQERELYLSNKHLTSGEWFELPITAGRRTHNLNLRPGPLLQPSAALHPSDIPAGAAPRPGQCEPLRRKHRRSYLGRFARVAHLARSIAPRTAAGVLLALAALLAAPMPIQAAGNAQLEPCSAEAPVPTAVAVTACPSSSSRPLTSTSCSM